ncbi:MAG: branched-chain amino acid ABC transporter permease [Deltaproteobacteria bacterium]|nr:branched-chain amino acid ABC transporter permease [Deltaproteobacteria bacterium]
MYELLQHLINGLSAGTIYALVALGYTMVYGVLKLINFAHGDVMMVGVYVGYAVAFLLGREATGSILGALLVFGLAMTACALLGLAIERFAYRPLREKPRLTALITAIGISFALSYGFQLDASVQLGGTKVTLLPGAASKRFPEVIAPSQWLVLGPDDDVIIWNWQVIGFLVAVALMGLLQVLVFKTRFGKAMRAVSFDHRTASLLGVPVDRVIALTFMLGSALAACAGLLFAMKDKTIQPLMGLYVGLKAFVAAVIGGIGNLPGAVVGALLLGLCEEFIVGYASAGWRDAVAFGFLIVVLLVRPEGLFGRVQAEKV